LEDYQNGSVICCFCLKAAEDEADRVRQERVKAYEAKKANSKPLLMSIFANLNTNIFMSVVCASGLEKFCSTE